MSDCQIKVEDLLYSVGVSDLSRHINHDRLRRIEEFGHALEPQILSQILYSEHGINVFKEKVLRSDLLLQYYPNFIDEIKSSPQQKIQDALEEFNNFNWGNNIKSKKFLALFDLDGCEITNSKSLTLEAQKDVTIDQCLYPYQNWTRKKINSFFDNKTHSKLLVQMPTGSGKTKTMLESVCDHIRQNKDSKTTIVWLAHSEELCEQAVESFEKIWSKLGSEIAQIIRLWGGMAPNNLDISKPTFIVTSFATAYQMTTTDSNDRFDLFSNIRLNCSLMIVDEAHQSIAPTYKAAIQLFSNRSTKIVGLTATPGRHGIDGKVQDTIDLAEFYENNHVNIMVKN